MSAYSQLDRKTVLTDSSYSFFEVLIFVSDEGKENCQARIRAADELKNISI